MDVSKNITRRAVFLFAAFLFFSLTAMVCHDTVCAGNSEPLQSETVRIPCSDMEYFSDSRFFRATGAATHPNPRVAERMARLEANAQLSAGISVSIQSVTSRYIAEHGNGATGVYIDAFEQLSRQTTERHLRNIQIVCNHVDAENGQYTVYLAVEVAVEDVLFDLEEEFKKDTAIQHLYDRSMLKELFGEEIGAMDANEEAEDP